MKYNFLKSIILLVAIFSIFQCKEVFAIGMVTDPIVIDNILRGQEIVKTVRVLNTEEYSNIVYQLKTYGKIQDWTTYYETDDLDNPITKVEVPAGQYYDIIAKFKVPDNVDNGSYEGEIAIYLEVAQKSDSEKVQMEIVQGLRKKVTINVSDTVLLDFSSSVLPLKYKLSQGEPLELRITYNNKGNVLITPDLSVKITNKDTNEVVHDVIYPFPTDKIKYVGVYERQTLPLIKWSTNDITPGKYRVDLQVLINKKSYYNSYFDLLITDHEFYTASLVTSLTNNKFVIIGGVILFAILGVAVVVFLIKSKKQKRASLI